jgi:hypothetical protein
MAFSWKVMEPGRPKPVTFGKEVREGPSVRNMMNVVDPVYALNGGFWKYVDR